MNWSTIGSIGEFVGAFGVIGSLIYLALQVRAGSKTLFTAMRESTFNSLKEFNYNVISLICPGFFKSVVRITTPLIRRKGQDMLI